MIRLLALIGVVILSSFFVADVRADEDDSVRLIGVASIDITPRTPIRLTGYAGRKTESEGVEQKLYAKALAIGTPDGPAVLITVDHLGVVASVVDEVAARLAKANVARERFVVCSTHTHTGPQIAGACPNIFQGELPPEQQEHIERYTRELTDNLEKVALASLKDMRPGKLSFGHGKATFAANRRAQDGPGGPVDHDLPVLRVTDSDGKLRAIVANYACHNTTMSGADNKICGDWAGYAAEYVQADHPGAVALISSGCGGDADPQPRTGLKFAQQHGREIATEVDRLIKTDLAPLKAPLRTQFKRIDLPFEPLPSRQQWEERAKKPGPDGFNAKYHLAKLDRGETIPTSQDYPIQTWLFGEEFAMVFLGGEVVVDYSLRLKKDFDPARLWISAYSNDVQCYIPSRRILKEGGYEAGDSMVWYGKPAWLAPSVENQIIRTVHEMMPVKLRTAESLLEFPPAKSPEEALRSFKLRDDLQIDLVAAEPLMIDPVAIDWGIDGKLWVVEMLDYPMGKNDNGTPGGRVKFLEDTDGDGKYDKATVFVDNLPYPTGVMAWRKGALICAAPNVIYAEDTDGDGRADVQKVLFTGFSPENQQWEVNGLSWGLDNWVYGASSARNDPIKGASGANDIDLGARDFRMNPDTAAFEPAAGRSQFGRTRDDWDNWFGCDNSTLLFHYPLPDHYVRRNPHVSPPNSSVRLPVGEDSDLLFPVSHTLARFNEPNRANRVTSACGLALYRDDLLGKEFTGNGFVCEPVHNLVHRMIVEPDGNTFSARRANDEAKSEFLASSDNWFRPAQARTGPDGALWIVDMYRFVIEHPRWIPADKLAQLDTRAGDDKGRIYRIYPRNAAPRPIRDLSKLSTEQLAAKLDDPSGTLRDVVHRELVHRADKSAAGALEEVFKTSDRPAVRVQAMCALDGIGGLTPAILEKALADQNPGVRRHAVRLSENMPQLAERVKALATDPDVAVRFQVALSLGQGDTPGAADALAKLAQADPKNQWMRAAILSSSTRYATEMLSPLIAAKSNMIDSLVAIAAATGDSASLAKMFAAIAPAGEVEPWHYSALAAALDALDRKGKTLADVNPPAELSRTFEAARKAAPKEKSALRLLGRGLDHQDEDLKQLADLLNPKTSFDIQKIALATMARNRSPKVAQLLLAGWPIYSPDLRATVLDTLLSRGEWLHLLLEASEQQVPAAEIDAAHRELLLKHDDPAVRARAAQRLATVRPASRTKVIEQYKPVLNLKGDAKSGVTTFQKLCTPCHLLGGIGHEVGPNLAAMSDRATPVLLTGTVDPNAAVETKYTAYVVETSDGRALSGIITGENAAGLTVLQGNGVRDTILRGDIRKMRSQRVSLMPEGLEQGLSPQQMADLIAFVQSDHTAATKELSITDRAALILDEKRPTPEREKALNEKPELAVDLIVAMTADLKPKTPDEYHRIPWIWRAAIAVGKRNDAAEVKRLLHVALPKIDEPLHDWQAVVIGGGIINGMSLQNVWPDTRLTEIIAGDVTLPGDAPLKQRWDRAIDLAATMADDTNVPNGTRYDALRMIPMQGWQRRGEQLRKYLAKGIDNELQQGAISGLSDIRSAETAPALLSGWEHYSEGNRNFTLDALLRDPARVPALREAVNAGRITREHLGDARAAALAK